VIRPALREVPATRPRARVLPLDVFVVVNLALFGAMCVFTYYARFVRYRGAANIHEFFLYATVLVAGVVLLWRAFRGYRFGAGLLLLVQAGILAHFAGAFVQWGGLRLYDYAFAGLRYDKYVHFANAFIAVRVVRHIVERHGIRMDGLVSLLVGLTVLGLGGVVEIVEYLVVRTVPANGVGGYDNNMQDLIANAVGAGVSLLVAGAGSVPLRPADRVAGLMHVQASRPLRTWSGIELGVALGVVVAVLWLGPVLLPRVLFPFVAIVLLALGLSYAVWISPVLLHRDSLAARGLGSRATWFVRTDNLRDAARPFTLLTLAGAVALLLLAAWWNPAWVARAEWRAWAVRLLFYSISAQVQALVFVGFVLVRLRDIFQSRGAVALAAGALFAIAHAPSATVMALTMVFASAAAWISVRTPNVVVVGVSQTVLGLLLHRALEEPLRVGYFYAHPDLHVFREALPVVGRVIGGLY
jgi:hypothetical protein